MVAGDDRVTPRGFKGSLCTRDRRLAPDLGGDPGFFPEYLSPSVGPGLADHPHMATEIRCHHNRKARICETQAGVFARGGSPGSPESTHGTRAGDGDRDVRRGHRQRTGWHQWAGDECTSTQGTGHLPEAGSAFSTMALLVSGESSLCHGH